ncbi:unnamed protein product [Oncorhynchus mykiss]|uniref:KASH5-like coiled-coil domain-containing protein n=1 Tax=Oncorhynchus mykiss TaxID=8022 RepID=A0A060XW86_ONCMY|nr:unnamed protein product [Oncorhynchus mykiss]
MSPSSHVALSPSLSLCSPSKRTSTSVSLFYQINVFSPSFSKHRSFLSFSHSSLSVFSLSVFSPLAKRSVLLNMTSGSLEAFGGEVSRADLETSDLVFCVSDLQFSNQKLQQEVRKLKQSVETMEDHNQKLAEENEELKSQARLGQQLAQKEKMLKDEVEEMKMSLSCTEEGRARASAQCKHMVYIYTHTISTVMLFNHRH